VLAIAAAKLGWGPVSGYDHERPALEAATGNASANGVKIEFQRLNLREELPTLAAAVVANLTAPLLLPIAARLDGDHAIRRMVLSGLLAAEADAVSTAFAGAGLEEQQRLQSGDWGALLLHAVGTTG
jgi:ribosomal protein L11 methyltransferase